VTTTGLPPRRQTAAPERSRLRAIDGLALAGLGVRTRRLRTALSAAGVALGVATLVAVLGISQSSSQQLIAQLDRLGTNLLIVAPSQLLGGGGPSATLPATSSAMVGRIGPVQSASAIGDVNAGVYRNDRINAANTGAITVYAARTNLLGTLQARLSAGQFLNGASQHFPAVVLGSQSAQVLGVDRANGTIQLWLGHRWFSVVGILQPVTLAPELDRSALIGFPEASTLQGSDALPVEIYVRVDPDNVNAVEAVLAATANPAQPQNVSVSRPTDALAARADAKAAFRGLFLALGAVALVVGGVGIANMMFLAVFERRGEIGLRRALGATRAHIAAQFLAESVLISGIGGVTGLVAGSLVTAIYAHQRHWSTVIPTSGLLGGAAAAIVVGALAGLYPAIRAARMAPTEALRTG
jgi:putative ABC transport system permease protein